MAAEHGIRGGVGAVGKRSAGPAAWTARKFCGIAYDTLRLPSAALLPASLRCHWRIFILFVQRRAGKKGYNKWVQLYLAGRARGEGQGLYMHVYTEQSSRLSHVCARQFHRLIGLDA